MVPCTYILCNELYIMAGLRSLSALIFHVDGLTSFSANDEGVIDPHYQCLYVCVSAKI